MTRDLTNTQGRAARRRRGRDGFTFAEIIIVIVILGIMAMVVVPMAVDASDTHAVAAASRITGDLEYAQNTAISSGKPVTVTFSAATDVYSLSDLNGLLTHPVDRKDFVVAFPSMAEMSEADILSVDFGGSSTVTFDEFGAPSDGGTVLIQAGSVSVIVSVTDVTGVVRVGMVGDDTGSFGCD